MARLQIMITLCPLWEKFAPPEAEEVKNKILSQELSIQEGVSQLFQFIPTNLHDEIIQFLIETAEIRNGFQVNLYNL